MPKRVSRAGAAHVVALDQVVGGRRYGAAATVRSGVYRAHALEAQVVGDRHVDDGADRVAILGHDADAGRGDFARAGARVISRPPTNQRPSLGRSMPARMIRVRSGRCPRRRRRRRFRPADLDGDLVEAHAHCGRDRTARRSATPRLRRLVTGADAGAAGLPVIGDIAARPPRRRCAARGRSSPARSLSCRAPDHRHACRQSGRRAGPRCGRRSCATSASLWVTRMSAPPASAMRRQTSRKEPISSGGSTAVGSSSSRSRGRAIRHLTISSRCRSPTEISLTSAAGIDLQAEFFGARPDLVGKGAAVEHASGCGRAADCRPPSCSAPG